MKNRTLLLLTDQHLHVQIMTGEKCVAAADFSDTDESRAEFAIFLRDHIFPAYLLVDLVAEDFRLETLPHLHGKNMRALLQRKFEQLYRTTPFRLATLLRRQSEGRQDDEMLFSALTHPSFITPWLEILQTQKIPLVGIYSVPHISAALTQDHPTTLLLLLTCSQLSGLRISYFQQRRLQFSRLTLLQDGQKYTDIIAAELSKTCQYLNSLSLLPADQNLTVRIVAHHADLAKLQTALPKNLAWQYDFIAFDTLAKQWHFPPPTSASDVSTLLLHLLPTQHHTQQYANREQRHYFALWQFRRALYGGSFALCILSLIWFLQTIYLSTETDKVGLLALQQQTTAVQNRTQTILQQSSVNSVPPTDMRTAVLTLRGLQQRAIPAQQFLAPLTLVLDRYPDVQLDELTWRANESAVDITINGHRQNSVNDLRSARDDFANFQRALAQQGYQTTVVHQPVDMTGNFSDATDAMPRKYTLRLIWSATP